MRVESRHAVAVLVATLFIAAPAAPGAAAPGLDVDFGNNGVARAPFRLAPLEVVSRGILVAARQRDGRLLVAGQIRGDDRGLPARVAVARFHRDGRLDRSFGRRGRLSLYFPNPPQPPGRPTTVFEVSSVSVQRNGRIVLAGSLSGTFAFAGQPTSFGLVRLLRDGSLDKDFGRRGFSTWAPRLRNDDPVRPRLELGVVEPQPDGRLIAAGVSEELVSMPAPPLRRLVLTRFRRDGSVDRSFGEGGEVSLDSDLIHARWAARPEGGLVAAGPRDQGPSPLPESIEVVRFNRDGSLDNRFGAAGTAYAGGNGFEIRHVHIDRAGGIVMAGGRDISGRGSIRMTRLNAEGAPDLSFGRECPRRIPGPLAGVSSMTFGAGMLITAWKRVAPKHGGGYDIDSRVLRFTRRGCFDPRAPRIALKGLAVGAPLRLGPRATVIPATYERGLALVRVNR